MSSSTNARLRRLPPLVMGALALALMIAILPSSLHLPITGPGGQAEVAPVPGQGNTQANLSQLGLADSGTVGGAGASALGDAFASPSPLAELLQGLVPGTGTVAQQSHCVGNPPRQTEDPLSPPCVPLWHGNNGGATTHGVSGDSITVADVSVYSQGGDYTAPASAQDSAYTRTYKVLLRYFQSRFQTYGRAVKIVGFRPSGGYGTQSAIDIDQRLNHPFAALEPDSTHANPAYASRTIEYFWAGGFSLGPTIVLPSRSSLTAGAPYIWSLPPSIDDLIASAAQYVCHTLQGRPASFAHDPTLASKTRRMALVYNAAGLQHYANDLDAATAQLCGFHFTTIEDNGNTQTDGTYLQAVSGARLDGDTTIFCFPCGDMVLYEREATREAYLPEYIFADGQPQRNAGGRQEDPTQWNDATGITWQWREPPMPLTYWWQAYQQIDPTGSPDRAFGQTIYEELMQLFGAIQLAGAHLTAQSVEAGMDTWHRQSSDPFSPTASYTPGSYSFVKDWMWERWDSSATPPGGAQEPGLGGSQDGCYRLVDDGARFDLSTRSWPSTNDAGARNDWPCGADEFSSADLYSDQAATQGH
ncbi:MAG: hypothetical protein ACYDGR_16695 [Candidatus Dormibacteria bacterium]